MTAPALTAIGIDFGGTSVKFAIVRGPAIVDRGTSLETQGFASSDAILEAMAQEIARLRERHPEVAAIGVGLPGMVDAEGGIVHELSNVPGWCDVALRSVLAAKTGLPVAIENDAKAMTYAEWRFGAAQDYPNVICVTLGTGVGGGLILGGRLYRGSANGAGEIGQTSIDHRGVPAVYGNLGAVEKYVGNREIAELARQRYREAGVEPDAQACTPKALSQAADGGDPVAAALWTEVGTLLGAALTNVVWLLNPDCIVLGGGVAKAGERLFKPIRDTIAARTMESYHQRLAIVPAALGSDAGVIGAAALGAEAAEASLQESKNR
ncbi:MAG TPA: ROK family protein [Chthoniobacteraceae bacterium]|nr:ROK family protein [Chthoniobacteraceae bacterium]